MFRNLIALAALPLAGTAAFAAAAGLRDATLVPAEALTVSIVDHGRVVGTLTARLSYAAADRSRATIAEEQMPRVRAACLAAMSEFARLRASPHDAVDVAGLKAAIDAAMRHGRLPVAEVLLLEVRARSS